MKIFLTGGTGFLGKNFIKQAVKKNNYIFATTRKKKNKKIKNLKWLVGPFDKNWKELKNSDVLVHMAAAGVYQKYTPFKKCYAVNVVQSSRLLNNAIRANCLKWVIIGSCTEYQIKNRKITHKFLQENKKSPYFNYAFSKFLFSNICLNLSKKLKIKCRVARLFHIYGDGEKENRLWPLLIKAAKEGKDFFMTKGDQKRDFTKVDDAAKSILKMANFKKKKKNFPQLWDLASGKHMSVKSFVKKVWKQRKAKGKLIFNSIKDYDKNNYIPNKKIIWKTNN